MAANQVAVRIVDFLQAVEIEEQYGERPATAIGALGFGFQNVQQTAVIGQTGERVADGEVADLLEETRIVQERAAEGYGVTGDREGLSENEWGIEHPLRLGGGELSPEIHPGGNVDRAVEGRVFQFEAAAIPNQGNEENSGRQELLRTGKNRTGMRRDFRREAPQRGGDEIGGGHYGEQGAGNFAPGMARTRKKVLYQESD